MEGIIGTHLVGSVPRPDTEAVFRDVLQLVPGKLKRIPDGETGERQIFTLWQADLFKIYPPMMVKFENNSMIHNDDFTQEQIDEGIEICRKANLETGYDKAAIESYAVFSRLREEGIIPSGVKFQVSLPTIGNVLMPFVQRPFSARLEPIYEERLFHAMRVMQDSIPHKDLAIQVDAAGDTAFWEALNPENDKKDTGLEWFVPWWDGDVKSYQVDYIVRQISQVDDDVDVGIHNCYGDMQHKHWYEPRSLAVVVERGQLVFAACRRKINWFHCPVPKSAEAFINDYLAPLRDLLPTLREHGTELILGLVHEHRPELTAKYIAAARKIVPSFAVAAECGGGRMEWEDFADMLRITDGVANPVV